MHTAGIEDLVVSEDGMYLFSASSDRTVGKWEIATGKCEAVLEGHDTSVYAVRVWEDEMWTGEWKGAGGWMRSVQECSYSVSIWRPTLFF